MKYFQFVIGCQMNHSDAERISFLLESHGCVPASGERNADLIVVVACSVRQKAVDRLFGSLKKWRQWRKGHGIKTLLTGCVLPHDRQKLGQEFDHLLDIKEIASLPKMLGLQPFDAGQGAVTNADYLATEPLRTSTFQASVPIMTGCNNYCTFCAVPYTRGTEASRPSSEIITEVGGLLQRGYREITLLGQNVNAYLDPEKVHSKKILNARSRAVWEFRENQPIQTKMASTKVPKDFANLLRKLDTLPGNFWLRFLSSNPQDISDELIATLPKCRNIPRHFHFALQSGDNEILRRMNRRHTAEDFLDSVKKIRASWPGVALSTDIIVGFPGETAEHFKKTLAVVDLVKFDMAYIAEYSPRPGTAAARFFRDDVPKKEKTRRKASLNRVLEKHALSNNKKLVGTTVAVLADSYQKSSKIIFGKTEGMKNIKFRGPNMAGDFVTVTVTKAHPWSLEGKLEI